MTETDDAELDLDTPQRAEDAQEEPLGYGPGEWASTIQRPSSVVRRSSSDTRMTAGEVCSRQVVFTVPNASLLEAARLMKQHHVGDVVVVDERVGMRRPIGIVTDRDIALSVADRARDLERLEVSDVMSARIVTSPEDQNLHDAVKRMQSHGVRRLPIVNATGGLEGILTFDDIVDVLSQQLVDLAKLIVREQDRERSPSQTHP